MNFLMRSSNARGAKSYSRITVMGTVTEMGLPPNAKPMQTSPPPMIAVKMARVTATMNSVPMIAVKMARVTAMMNPPPPMRGLIFL